MTCAECPYSLLCLRGQPRRRCKGLCGRTMLILSISTFHFNEWRVRDLSGLTLAAIGELVPETIRGHAVLLHCPHGRRAPVAEFRWCPHCIVSLGNRIDENDRHVWDDTDVEDLCDV